MMAQNGEDMQEIDVKTALKDIDKGYKDLDAMYHAYSKFCKLSDSEQWFIYSLWSHRSPCTQKDFCNDWFYSPQTINSALKSLEADGLIRLEFVPGSKKNKNIVFTQAGEEFCRKYIDPLLNAEMKAFCALDKDEKRALISVNKKYNSLLRDEIGKLTKIQTNQW